MAAAERRTLLIDMDPQANASSGVGVKGRGLERSIYDCLIGRAKLSEVVVPTDVPGLIIAPATQDLVAAEIEIIDHPDRALKLKNALAQFFGEDDANGEPHESAAAPGFDYVFIDCPPSLGLLTVNALAAADRVIVPLQCEYYALEGLTHLMATIDRVKNGINPSLGCKASYSRCSTLEIIWRTKWPTRCGATSTFSIR